jgi:hypothetical protein
MQYHVTLRHIHETIVAVEKQEVLHISVCVGKCLHVCVHTHTHAWVGAVRVYLY